MNWRIFWIKFWNEIYTEYKMAIIVVWTVHNEYRDATVYALLMQSDRLWYAEYNALTNDESVLMVVL